MIKAFNKGLFLFLVSLLIVTASYAQNITVGAIDAGPYGQGSTIGVPIRVDNTSGCIATGNTYRLYLSDASGNFAAQVQIGTYAGFYATFVNGIIPATTPAGTAYRVRVVSTNPSVTSNPSASFAINAVTGVVASVSSQTLNAAYPEVFGACIGTNNASYPFINNSTSGATVTATFFNEITKLSEGAAKPVPGTFNAKTANYTVTVRAVKDGVIGTKSYTLINNDVFRSISSSGSNTACTDGSPLNFPITIDDNGIGIKYNYPGLIYKVSWGDGTSSTYRYCDIVNQGNAISHVFTKSSCGNNVGNQKNVFRVEITPTNLPYCNTAVIPGVAYARIVSPPKNDFLHPVAACVGSQATFNNISDPGQDPENTISECKNLDAKYTWYVDDNPEKIDYTVTQQFNYTFLTAGIHKVRLHLQNPNALCDVQDKEYEICIQEPPRPAFTLPVKSGCLPLAITANSTASFIDKNCDAGNSFIWKVTGPAPVKYQGGTSATSENPQFLFDAVGIYTIKLSIKTASCGTIDAPTTDTVIVDGPPVAILSADKNICGFNQTFIFDGTAGPTQSTISGSAQANPGNYAWTVTGGDFEFTGNTTASSRYPQILFKEAAAYTISVTATSACGAPKTDSQVLTFQPAPVVDAGTSGPVCNGSTVPLQGTVTNGTVNNVLWTGGAGVFSNASNLITTYTPTAAEYAVGSVTLTLTGFTSLDAPCNQITDNIVINFKPVNAVNSVSTYFTCPGIALGYNITALQPGSTFSWTVDAANTSPTITGYNAMGSGNIINDVLLNTDVNNSAIITYHITVTNGTCTSNDFVLTVTVGPKSPFAKFTHNLPEGAGCGPTLVQFTNNSAPVNGSTFEWVFGDQTTSNQVNPSHQFLPNADGSDAVYNVTLTITSPCGIATSAVQTIIVRPLIPVVRIVPPFVAACLPVTLSVKNESPGTNIDYTYYFYKYNDTKTDSTLIFTTNVTTKDPVDIGPVTEPGNYILFMRARGFCGTTGETVHIPFTIDARSFDSQIFATGLTEGCDGNFTARIFNNSTPGNTYTYFITNADGTFNDSKVAALGGFNYVFPGPGVYYVTLTTQNSCDNKVSSALKFTVFNKPQPDFTADLTKACSELTVQFTNNTLPDPTTQPTSMIYEWDFGDGTTSALYNPPPHKYVARNIPYTVTLKATIALTGCTNMVTKTNYIIVTQPPGTSFDVKPGLVANLPNYRFEFVDRTTGRPINWQWDFGDNTTANTQNTNHTYADTGKYIVTLKVIDDKGCDSTFKQEIRITGIPGQLYLPNAFQPQGSSTVLQKFMAKGSGIAKWNLQIFNNWGQLLWQTSALSSTGEPVEGWDGTFKGIPVQQGVYIWQASATFKNGTEWKGMSYNGSLPKRNGYINLIK